MINKTKQIQNTFFALGTANTITINFDEKDEAEVKECLGLCQFYLLSVDDRMSFFKENSEITKINQAAGCNAVIVSEDTFEIIEKAVYFSRLSEGSFDLTAGTLSRLWGIGKKGDYIPTQSEIEESKKLISWNSIRCYKEPYRVELEIKGQSIDLGGIAKGYAADMIRKILLKHKINDAVINLGGNVITIDNTIDREKGLRRVGIRSPLNKKSIIGTLKISNKAVVTSGKYERFFEKEGIRYHHILNPKTGRPAETGLSSATLVGSSAMDMDALATIFILNGLEKGMPILNKIGADGVFVTEAGEIYITERLRNNFVINKGLNKQG